MKRQATLLVLVASLSLAVFFLLGGPGETRFTLPAVGRSSAALAAAGVALLIADVLLPVPSSLIMIANGAAFGTFAGALLSLCGCLGATWLGFLFGRLASPLVLDRLSVTERRRADRLFRRWGALAILVTRPVPILAESVAVVAGTSAMSIGAVTVAALAGALPASILLALTGATASDVDVSPGIFLLVLVISAGFWQYGRGVSSASETTRR